jgi:hypothetical protein
MKIASDFIAVWDNVVPKEFCDMLVANFEYANNIAFNLNPVDPLGRNDQSYVLNYHNEHAPVVYNYLQPAFAEYVNNYQQLSNVKLFPSEIKMQRTQPSGGYHTWHYESHGWDVSHRELAWMIYLNDISAGEGETEFLYQKIRVQPTVGTIVIWPAGMTHVHRGNTVFTKDKYILTGWFIKTP